MGLDAIVYRNVKSLGEAYGDAIRFEIDKRTGEPCSADPLLNDPNVQLAAIQRRLGNVDDISFLRELLSQFLKSDESVLMRKVVYSATHSGDVIELGDLALLRAELDLVSRRDDPRLQVFHEAMKSLVQAAEIEQNPIVFL